MMRTFPLVLAVAFLAFVGVLTGVTAQDSPKLGSSGAATVEYLPRPSAAEKQISEALETVVDANFADTPFPEVADFLRNTHKVNIVIDAVAIQQVADGAELPNVNLAVSQIRLRSVLNLLCKSVGLAWMIDDEVIKITTQAAVDNQFIVRTYPVGDLCSGPDDLKTLRTAIEKTTTAAGWDTLGGQGSVAAVDAARSLVITTTGPGHQQVLNVLRMLREARDLSANAGLSPIP